MIVYVGAKPNGTVGNAARVAGKAVNTGTPYTCFVYSTILAANNESVIRIDALKKGKSGYDLTNVIIPAKITGKRVYMLGDYAFSDQFEMTESEFRQV